MGLGLGLGLGLGFDTEWAPGWRQSSSLPEACGGAESSNSGARWRGDRAHSSGVGHMAAALEAHTWLGLGLG